MLRGGASLIPATAWQEQPGTGSLNALLCWELICPLYGAVRSDFFYHSLLRSSSRRLLIRTTTPPLVAATQGLSQSFGMMVNYKYLIDDVERHNRDYLVDGQVYVTHQVLEVIGASRAGAGNPASSTALEAKGVRVVDV